MTSTHIKKRKNLPTYFRGSFQEEVKPLFSMKFSSTRKPLYVLISSEFLGNISDNVRNFFLRSDWIGNRFSEFYVPAHAQKIHAQLR